MNRGITQTIARVSLTLAMGLAAAQTYAFSGGFGSFNSGGESSSGSSTNCSSAGDSTSGGSFSGGFGNFSGTGSEECANEDSDADTMLNSWETSFSLDKNDASDAYEDADGDGSTNAREYAQGSDASLADTDSDGVIDGDDPDPDNAGVSSLTVDGTFSGISASSSD